MANTDYQRILLPMEFSEHCYRAARHAAQLAGWSGGAVHLAHVVENPLDPIYEPEAVQHWVVVEHADKKARELLEAVAARCLPAETPRELHVLSGDPYPKIMALAEQINADLIVLATHGTSSLAHRLLGGIAEKVTHHARCPVLLVREAS
ncbi:MAG: universal stress protein [Candidatus Binatia bacterium]